MGYAWMDEQFDRGFIVAMAGFAGLYWYAMGSLLTGERSGMSQRVRRRLPQSFFGRAFLSWLNPGPASGYMFVVANGTAIVMMGFLGLLGSDFFATRGAWPSNQEAFFILVVGWSYGVTYLGLGKMAISLLRRVAQVNLFAGALIHFLVLLAASGIPTTIQLMSYNLRMQDYSYWQLPNPFWSLEHLGDGGVATEGPILITLVPAAAICVLLLNMRSVVRELQAVRIAPPSRVIEDEAELHPTPEPLPQNPWDEPATT
jgi:hypothetical protein